jgi:putative flavoprotein involved in K+ transport
VGGGHDLSPRLLAAHGVHLLGQVRAVRDTTIVLGSELAQHLAAGEATRREFQDSVDEYIRQTGLNAPADEPREREPTPAPTEWAPRVELELRAEGITAVIWATGFRYDFRWVKLPVFDDAGEPVHRRGVTACRGVYFLGLQWLHKYKSTFIYGVSEDATYLAEQLTSGTP